MIYGIGIDVVRIKRIEEILIRNEEHFLKKILTEKERQLYPKERMKRAEFVAGRFAGKEAVAKALGTGIGSKLKWKDIEIGRLASGQPIVKLNDDKLVGDFTIHISISHTDDLAMAKVIIEQK
ncbi:hypothetical protein BHF71_05520 [Vulcanibacillus modesticaldus]|uniref:Holo-[acyl-carrier-protein] synthase n=1 Tax=Vulcanibacillus modesticaldus TaxID=337097 RepID=A0A1D2YXB5_9BACI|nr:holo-ACP synthase [Vulcanibacillus modesticaldus]OEG00247.1 hypothetical protein BHF71_05520 [Vulcanibacillus modesticaldus]